MSDEDPLLSSCALCVSIDPDSLGSDRARCRLISAEDLQSVLYRPSFPGVRVGHWYRAVNSPPCQRLRYEPITESVEKPMLTRITETTDSGKLAIQFRLPVCVLPDLSKFGFKLKEEGVAHLLHCPMLPDRGFFNVRCELKKAALKPGILYPTFLSLDFNDKGLPQWMLESMEDIVPEQLEESQFASALHLHHGIVLQMLTEVGGALVAILSLADSQLAFGRVFDHQNQLCVGAAVTFLKMPIGSYWQPAALALNIAKGEVTYTKIEAVAGDLFLLRLQLNEQLFKNDAKQFQVAGIGTVLDLENVLGTHGTDASTTVTVQARLHLMPERSIPFWTITKFIGKSEGAKDYDFPIANRSEEGYSTPAELDTSTYYECSTSLQLNSYCSTATAAASTPFSELEQTEELEDEDEQRMPEKLELEQEALVLFTQLVRLELHMRFFDENECKFTRYRCCKRKNLPSFYAINTPPIPGTWAQITYTECEQSVRHIVISDIRVMDSNFGAVLRFAMEVVRPDNEKIWTTLLVSPYRPWTVKQLLDAVMENNPSEDVQNGLNGRNAATMNGRNGEFEEEAADEENNQLNMNNIASTPAPSDEGKQVSAIRVDSSVTHFCEDVREVRSMPSSSSSLPISKQFDPRIEMIGIVVLCEYSSNAGAHHYQVWPFCTNRFNERLLNLKSSMKLKLGDWLKFDIPECKNAQKGDIDITEAKCNELKPWFTTKVVDSVGPGPKLVSMETCITIPRHYGREPEAEVWTYSWKPGNNKVPFICKLLPRSVEIEQKLQDRAGTRCIARLQFTPYLDKDGTRRGHWHIFHISK